MLKSQNYKILIFVVIAIFIGILLGVAIFTLFKSRSNYVAVFMNNGFVYFGKLSTFPRLKLINPVYIQVDQNGNPSLQRFTDAFWQPRGVIYLNKQNIAFIVPIKNTSPLINFIESALALPVQQPSVVPSQPQQLPLQPRSPSQSQSQSQQPMEVIQEPVQGQ